jgi:hypothetical protein
MAWWDVKAMAKQLTLIDKSETINTPVTLSGMELINSVLDINSSLKLTGRPDMLVHSALTTDSLDNEGWIVDTQNSGVTISGNLTGSGQITELGSSMHISGGAPTSETIGLVGHSQLYLGSEYGIPTSNPSPMAFMATVDIDSTSTIHFTDQDIWSSIGSNVYAQLSGEVAKEVPGLVSLLAVVHSLTPGYAPQPELQFASNSPAIIGLIIVDKPIIAAHS